jgi:hypothetical protein
VLQNVDNMGKVKGSCDVQETQVLCGLTIERLSEMSSDRIGAVERIIKKVQRFLASKLSATKNRRSAGEVHNPRVCSVTGDGNR